MQNKFAIFKMQPSAQPRNSQGREIPDFANPNAPVGNTGFRIYGDDISDIDLSNAGDKLKYIRFDNRAIFPTSDKLPADFNPKKVLEEGKDPGLGVKNLHKRGITGRGIRIAIIDQPLDTNHIEYKDNIIHYEHIGYTDQDRVDLHGPAVASLLCGKTTGVAPDAELIYFAACNQRPTNDKEQPLASKDGRHLYAGNHASALRKILFMNTALPDGEKIDAVSISWGMLGTDPECRDLINKLIKSGVMVLTTDSKRFYDKNATFTTIDRLMNTNPDNPKSYAPGFWRKFYEKDPNAILVPAGGRTIAGFFGHENYIYCGCNAGMSWATPYLVGVYALAKQVYPKLTSERFFELAHQTGTPMNIDNKQCGIIAQPEKIIDILQRELIIQQQLSDKSMKQ